MSDVVVLVGATVATATRTRRDRVGSALFLEAATFRLAKFTKNYFAVVLAALA